MTEQLLGQDIPDDGNPPVAEPGENNNYLTTLVGEGKKYKTEADLARAYIHADRHIRDLEDELKEMREHGSTLDEILKELRTAKPNAEEPPVPNNGHEPTTQKFGEEDVARLVEKTLTQKQQKELAEKNRSLSFEKLAEIYGGPEQAVAALGRVVKARPQLREALNRLGDTDPEALVKMVQAYETPAINNPNLPNGKGPSADATLSSIPKDLTWHQAQEIRRKDPKMYHSPEFRKKLEEAVAGAEAQGKDFFST